MNFGNLLSNMFPVIMFILFLSTFIIFLSYSIISAKKRSERRHKVFEEIALEIGAIYEKPLKFIDLTSFIFQGKSKELLNPNNIPRNTGFPVLELPLKGSKLRCTYHSSGGKNPIFYTDIFIEFEKPYEYKLRIYPEGFFSKIGKSLGMQDIEIGDPDFDGQYIIKCNNPDSAMQVVNSHFKQVFIAMCSFKYDNIDFTLEGHDATFQKTGLIEDKEELKQYILMGKQIAEILSPHRNLL